MHLTHSQRIPDLARAPATEYGPWSLDPLPAERPGFACHSARLLEGHRRAGGRGRHGDDGGCGRVRVGAPARMGQHRPGAGLGTRPPAHGPPVELGRAVAPRHVAGSVPTATSGRWVTPTLGTPVTAPRWT